MLKDGQGYGTVEAATGALAFSFPWHLEELGLRKSRLQLVEWLLQRSNAASWGLGGISPCANSWRAEGGVQLVVQ